MAKTTTTTKKKTAAKRKKKTASTKKKTTVEQTEEETQPEEAVKKTVKKTKRKSRAKKKTTTAVEPTDSGVADASEKPAETAVAASDESAVGEAPAAPKTKKKTRRRRKTKSAAPKPTEPTPDEPKSPDEVKSEEAPLPRTSAARIERNDDSIVIRFPSDDEAPPEETATSTDKGAAKVDEDELSLSVDWDDAEPQADPLEYVNGLADVEEPKMKALESEPEQKDASSDASDESSSEQKDAAEPKRGRSRRRRRRKHKRPEESEGEADERSESAAAERKLPDYDDDAEQAEETKPEIDASAEDAPQEEGRRRRSRRGRGRGGKARKAAAEEAPPKAEPAPSKGKEMIINVSPREECRIAIMDRGKLQEIYLERSSSENYVGNIYKGVITNVEPSIQAAFIDFGQGKNGFLHISDLHPRYFPNGEGDTENVGRKMPRRSRPPIQRCLRRGQQVLVQITKEGIGTKGPTLTTYLSIPGRFLVMMPGMRQLGVSRKIEDDEERRKLKQQLNELELPDDSGFIARTAALGRTKRELQSDLNYLSRLWKSVDNRIKKQKAPTEIYTESDLVTRTIRDVYSSDIERILIDDADVAERAHEFISIFSPRSRDIVVHYDEPEPVFHRYGIEEELDRLHSRYVPLESGGSLVIDQTEALVAIDVNSGRFRTEDDAETTAYKIDLEAADEIPRQLRLRDLGGVVICDFIDVRMEKHKREIERRLIRNLKEHKERAKVLRMSEFGLIELTRQRQRASLTRNVYKDCTHCRGTGLVKTAESVALDVMRTIQLAATKENIATIEVSVSMEVADMLLNRKRASLNHLESTKKRKISIHAKPDFGLDQIAVLCHDQRGRVIPSP